ncbi:BZ3500_MvSof-1268-A1-R1_Chr5-2g08089 [Microbotryum saponariae]|uniref:Succinate dehydrogenase assembly factor 4, mitochondrial n=1 Tax=Microbotryum saponariae TaxID=289078 RepID=A0A2X0LLB2_9BASI|nr:BZ3500_MvSof-1268-A1-R1_Chr5-2g08089 [Microbotryum saponariae]SDA05958.1 BZ3501_MvSof-1269-A2-R1_Chr5-2g07911 [Microbotryum saponariae]
MQSVNFQPRHLSTSHTPFNNSFSRPSPPPLPRSDQKEFEDLQRRVNAPASQQAQQDLEAQAELAQTVTGTEEDLTMHPDYRKTPEPTFQGDTNPETGEVGGPKREPLVHGDWSYGGRATDF